MVIVIHLLNVVNLKGSTFLNLREKKKKSNPNWNEFTNLAFIYNNNQYLGNVESICCAQELSPPWRSFTYFTLSWKIFKISWTAIWESLPWWQTTTTPCSGEPRCSPSFASSRAGHLTSDIGISSAKENNFRKL